MTESKKTVEKYMDGFRKNDHAQILSCLTEDIEWEIPGVFHVVGKNAFEGNPGITILRMAEENDVVVAEGKVSSQRKVGSILSAMFCDVFILQDVKIKKLTSYLVELKESAMKAKISE